MKIAVVGYSGSGKSTLSRTLGSVYSVPVLHLDMVFHKADWQERDQQEQLNTVDNFLLCNDSWVIDGNYKSLFFDRRMQDADHIVLMLFPRSVCLFRVIKRYRQYKGQARPDVSSGCYEKLDREFIRWILWEGRTKTVRKRYDDIRKTYPDKTVVLKSQKQLDNYIKKTGYTSI